MPAAGAPSGSVARPPMAGGATPPGAGGAGQPGGGAPPGPANPAQAVARFQALPPEAQAMLAQTITPAVAGIFLLIFGAQFAPVFSAIMQSGGQQGPGAQPTPGGPPGAAPPGAAPGLNSPNPEPPPVRRNGLAGMQA